MSNPLEGDSLAAIQRRHENTYGDWPEDQLLARLKKLKGEDPAEHTSVVFPGMQFHSDRALIETETKAIENVLEHRRHTEEPVTALGGNYDDGHNFGWRAQSDAVGEPPTVTTLGGAPAPDESLPGDVALPGSYDSGHDFGWRRKGASEWTTPPPVGTPTPDAKGPPAAALDAVGAVAQQAEPRAVTPISNTVAAPTESHIGPGTGGDTGQPAVSGPANASSGPALQSDPDWPFPDLPNNVAALQAMLATEFPDDPAYTSALKQIATGQNDFARWNHLNNALSHAKMLAMYRAEEANLDALIRQQSTDNLVGAAPSRPKDPGGVGHDKPPDDGGLSPAAQQELSDFFLHHDPPFGGEAFSATVLPDDEPPPHEQWQPLNPDNVTGQTAGGTAGMEEVTFEEYTAPSGAIAPQTPQTDEQPRTDDAPRATAPMEEITFEEYIAPPGANALPNPQTEKQPRTEDVPRATHLIQDITSPQPTEEPPPVTLLSSVVTTPFEIDHGPATAGDAAVASPAAAPTPAHSGTPSVVSRLRQPGVLVAVAIVIVAAIVIVIVAVTGGGGHSSKSVASASGSTPAGAASPAASAGNTPASASESVPAASGVPAAGIVITDDKDVFVSNPCAIGGPGDLHLSWTITGVPPGTTVVVKMSGPGLPAEETFTTGPNGSFGRDVATGGNGAYDTQVVSIGGQPAPTGNAKNEATVKGCP